MISKILECRITVCYNTIGQIRKRLSASVVQNFAFCTTSSLMLFILLLFLRNFRKGCFTYGMDASLLEWMCKLKNRWHDFWRKLA